MSGLHLLFISFFVLIGCSQTTVHLNNRYLDEQQTAQLIVALEDKGINVKLNQHPFPKRVTGNTLIYSPMLRHPEVIQELQDELKAMGWLLNDTRLLVESNQWFTKHNLGLFLAPDNVQVHSGQTASDLAHIYQADACDQPYQLWLDPDGQFRMVSLNADDVPLTGKWQLTEYPYIRLFKDDNYLNFYYQVAQTKIRDAVGSVDMITLTPLSSSPQLPNCILSSGIRSQRL